MADTPDASQILMQMSGTMAKIEENQRSLNSEVLGMRKDIGQFQVEQTRIQERLAQAQKDIGSRTHKEETSRLRTRIEEAELRVEATVVLMDTKANNKLVWWIMGMIGSMFVLVVGAAVKLLFLP